MKVIFLGTPEFALNVLKSIDSSHHQVCAVVCQPSKPKGRGGKLEHPPTKVYADEKGISVYQFNKISKEGVDVLKSLNADIMVTAAYGQILSQEVLDITKYGVINVHASLLPKYRGSSPIQWAIRNGETKTGVTIMKTEAGIDTGDMLLSKECEITEDDTDQTMFTKLGEVGAEIIVDALDLIEQENAVFVPQSQDYSYFPMIKKETAKLDFSLTAKEVCNTVRAFSMWPTAHFNIGEQTFKVFKADVYESEISGQCGEVVLSSSKTGLVIKCKGGAVEIKEIQAPNSKRMRAKDYLNGKSIEVGTIVC